MKEVQFISERNAFTVRKPKNELFYQHIAVYFRALFWGEIVIEILASDDATDYYDDDVSSTIIANRNHSQFAIVVVVVVVVAEGSLKW